MLNKKQIDNQVTRYLLDVPDNVMQRANGTYTSTHEQRAIGYMASAINDAYREVAQRMSDSDETAKDIVQLLSDEIQPEDDIWREAIKHFVDEYIHFECEKEDLIVLGKRFACERCGRNYKHNRRVVIHGLPASSDYFNHLALYWCVVENPLDAKRRQVQEAYQ